VFGVVPVHATPPCQVSRDTKEAKHKIYDFQVVIEAVSRAGIGSVFVAGTCRTVRGSNPGGDEIFRNRPDRPWGLPSLL